MNDKKSLDSLLPWRKITKVQELIYELKIRQVMTTPVISVTPVTSMSELREILRTRQISGAPVLEVDHLVGIVSIEDLLKALSQGATEALVQEWMSPRVITVLDSESVTEAVKSFTEFRVGRLPVVNGHGKVVGILTGVDITRGLLEAIGLDYHQEEIERYRASHIFEDIVSSDTSLILRYKIPFRDFEMGGDASSKIRRALDRLGAHPQTVRRAAICAYEAEMNIIIHASAGGEIVAEIQPYRVKIIASDEGPGIENVEKAMEPGYSTAPEWIRELGFGAGMGLQNIHRCADHMLLASKPEEWTHLEIEILIDSPNRRKKAP